jgi:hypothetical protein
MRCAPQQVKAVDTFFDQMLKNVALQQHMRTIVARKRQMLTQSVRLPMQIIHSPRESQAARTCLGHGKTSLRATIACAMAISTN